MDLSTLNYSDLKKLQKDIENEFKTRQSKTYSEAKAKVLAITKEYGLSIEEIFAGKTAKASNKVAPKYRNPENTEQTWTGRGKKPIWVTEAQKQGKSLEDLAI